MRFQFSGTLARTSTTLISSTASNYCHDPSERRLQTRRRVPRRTQRTDSRYPALAKHARIGQSLLCLAAETTKMDEPNPYSWMTLNACMGYLEFLAKSLRNERGDEIVAEMRAKILFQMDCREGRTWAPADRPRTFSYFLDGVGSIRSLTSPCPDAIPQE